MFSALIDARVYVDRSGSRKQNLSGGSVMSMGTTCEKCYRDRGGGALQATAVAQAPWWHGSGGGEAGGCEWRLAHLCMGVLTANSAASAVTSLLESRLEAPVVAWWPASKARLPWAALFLPWVVPPHVGSGFP